MPASLHPPWSLSRCRLPRAALADTSGWAWDADGFAWGVIEVDADGRIATLRPVPDAEPGMQAGRHWIVFPPLVEPHTHIDKAFLRARAPNPAQSFQGARAAIERDRAGGWSIEDASLRMRRAVELAIGHGVVALRTHLDSQPDRLEPCWRIFTELREHYRSRIALQAVASLASAKLHGEHGDRLGRLCAEHGALLGPVFYADQELSANVARSLELARRYGIDLDAHIDENNHGRAEGLRSLLAQLRRTPLRQRISLSHLCSLGRCSPNEIDRLAHRGAEAGIGVIALPVANLHLQDRDRGGFPRWRGLPPVNALLRAGVRLAIGGDNSQDMFVPWGALDPLASLRDALLAAHLDLALGDAVALIAADAAELLGLPGLCQLAAGQPADLSLFEAEDPHGALSGDWRQRLTLRRGRIVYSRVCAEPDQHERAAF